MADALVLAAAEEEAAALAGVAVAAGVADVAVRHTPSGASPASVAAAAAEVARAATAPLVLVGNDLTGCELAPRIAAISGAACATDVKSLSLSGDAWTWSTDVYGGALEATLRCRGALVAAVDLRAVEASPVEVYGQALEVQPVPASCTRLSRQDHAGTPLEQACRIVAGGRGVGGPEGFDELARLAAVLGAETASSRPPCDAGWVPSTRQVGITGRKVAPDLYFAVGISGSVQHLAGIRGAGTVVAVNSDPDAAIFAHADIGVVGDWQQVTAELTAALCTGAV